MRAALFLVCALGPCYGFILLGIPKPSRVAVKVEGSRSSPETTLLAGTAIGGSLVGLTAGGLLDGALANGDAPWAPLLGCLLVGGGAFYAASETTGPPQVLATGLLGRPTLALGSSLRTGVLNQIERTRVRVNSIPAVVGAMVEKTIQVGQAPEPFYAFFFPPLSL